MGLKQCVISEGCGINFCGNEVVAYYMSAPIDAVEVVMSQ